MTSSYQTNWRVPTSTITSINNVELAPPVAMVSSDNDSTNNNSITCTSSILVATTTNFLKLQL